MNCSHWSQEHDDALRDMTGYLRIVDRSPRTIDCYTRGVRDFFLNTPKPLEQIVPRDAFDYLVHLKEDRGLAGKTLNQKRAALKVLYSEVLHQTLPSNVIKYSKKALRIPEVLELKEATSFFRHCPDVRFRVFFMTLYSSGLRVSEATHLKIHDIDSSKMLINVRAGKGGKDRKTLLSEKLLEELRLYWKVYRPKDWLFPGKDPRKPLAVDYVQRVCKTIALKAGISKQVTPHTFRHTFATELLKAGVNLRYIQELLGHKSIQSTMIYLKVVPDSLQVKSPLDRLEI